MGVEIDRLELQVEAQATKANNQLDNMVKKLDRVASSLMNINHGGLTGLANGVSKFAQASGQLSNVRTADFTRLAKNIQSISSINTQQIYSAASAMTMISKAMNNLGSVSANSMQVAQVAKDISKLGGANVQRAVTNLPQLATALSTFMTVMSKAPAVSDNIIRMTNALASLASQGGKVGTATRTVSNALNAQNSSITRNTKNVNGLASALGKLYQKYFWIRRIASKVWDSTESSMDFLETVNYFEVAMRDIGDSAAAQWAENGYSSAEAYAESFSERAKQLTEKMTGYSVDKDGNATYLGVKNLGMDPEKVLQYQATYAQISSSIGVAEESALNFSKALTMLGADWASLRNLSFDQAWEKFASALAGQSRAVRALGIDITNATLQEYAYKHGLEIAVSEMNQATKAQLRLLAILDQSVVAYGDLANTIESPANQIRMLQQNASNLGRVFGNLFLPVLQKTLPYINGTVIALQNLFAWVGNLLGIKFESINSSMGGMSEEMSDLVGGVGDFEDGLNGANNAAKKLNKTLQSWHEINNITTKDKSGSSSANIGGGSPVLDDAITKALADYEKAWNEAFDKMENKDQKFAEKIGKYLQPVKDIIKDFAIGDYFKAGQDTSSLVAGIFNFFADAIDNVDWEKLGQNMGDYLAGIDWTKILNAVGELVWQGLKAALELWIGSFEKAPFETLTITFGAIAFKFGALALTKEVFSGLLAGKLGLVAKSHPFAFAVAATLSITWALKHMIRDENSAPRKYVEKVLDDGIEKGVLTDADKKETEEALNNFKWFDIDNIKKNFEEVKKGWKNLFNFGGNTGSGGHHLSKSGASHGGGGHRYDDLLGISTDEIESSVKSVGSNIVSGISVGMEDTSSGIWQKTSEKIAYDMDNALKGTFQIHSPAKKMYPIGENIFLGIVEGFTNNFSAFKEAALGWWNDSVNPWFTKEKWEELGNNAKEGLSEKWNEYTTWWDKTGIPNWWDNYVTPWFTEEKWEELGQNMEDGLTEKWNSFTVWWKTTGLFKWWTNDVEPFFSKDKWTWDGITSGMSQAWENAIAGIKEIWNRFAEWLNDKLNFSWDATTIMGKEVIPAGSVNLGKIPTFSTGGFPEDGLFMANHSELVGKFANGRTAVANNEQIVAGIEEAAYRGMTRALMENGGNVTIHVEGDSSGMYRVWKEEYKSEAERLQHNPVPIF